MSDNLNTHKKLADAAKEKEAELRELELAYGSDELYKQYKEQLDELNEQREKLRIEMARMRREHIAENRDEINFLKGEVSYLKNLAFHSDGLDPKNYSYDIQTLFKNFYAGTTTRSDLKRLVWVSPDERYVILKRKGYGGGEGWGAFYMPVEFTLYSVEDSSLGYDLRIGLDYIKQFEGRRWSKKMLKEFQEAIRDYECNQE